MVNAAGIAPLDGFGRSCDAAGHMRFLSPLIGLLALPPLCFSAGGGSSTVSEQQDELVAHAQEPWRGDLDGITARGFLRILTVHNPLFFTFDGVEQLGMVAELATLYEDHLAEEIDRVRSPTVVVIPVGRDELIPGLIEGRGDLVMGNLTITPDRQEQVAFGPPMYSNVDELVITGPAAKHVASFDDLVKTDLYVRRSSSYYGHLRMPNAEREARGQPPIPIIAADEYLEDYDLLDLVNAGIIKAIVVDSHKADFWEQVFDRIEVHRDLAVHSGTRIAWAIRKHIPQLMASITAFGEKVEKGSLLGNIGRNRYLGDTQWIENVRRDEEGERYEETIEVIKRYSGRYQFDWRLIAAQAYQESRFEQGKRSPAGAVGVMQVLPDTAASEAVDITNFATGKQCPCRREMPALAAPDLLLRPGDCAARPRAVLVCRLQRRARQHETRAPAGTASGFRPEPLVRQCRNRHVPRGKRRTGRLRAQYLQVLRQLPGPGRIAPGAPESA